MGVPIAAGSRSGEASAITFSAPQASAAGPSTQNRRSCDRAKRHFGALREARVVNAVPWSTFARFVPDLASFAKNRFDAGPAYLATTMADGAPRVHPVNPDVRGGRFALYMFPTSPKGRDLRRDGRYALHTSVLDVHGGGGEVAVRGLALWGEEDLAVDLSTAGFPRKEGYVRFELRIGSVLIATYGGTSNVPSIQRWSAAP